MRAVTGDPALELVAAIDPAHAGETVEGITIVADPADINGDVDVVIDFTRRRRPRQRAVGGRARRACGRGHHRVHPADLEAFAAAFTRSNCVIAPNFAIGAVLMIAFAERAAPFFETAEVVEMHHDAKRDAPSGTAMLTAERIAAASSDWAPDPTELTVVPGARGGADPSGIHVHALRVRGAVASQEVILGTTGQSAHHPPRHL